MVIECYGKNLKFGGSCVNYEIEVSWDESAGVWCGICDSIPVALESNSFDALITRVKIAAYELLELNGKISENIQLCFKTTHLERIA
jgi:hypothetical protein